MKIKEISFKNKKHRWELERTTFSDLTLLVGASGVGKTQILKSIEKLKNISNGYAYNGVEWDFHFTTDTNESFRWTGEFETIKEIEQQEFKSEKIFGNVGLKQAPKLLNEKLFLENKLIFERKGSDVQYENKDVPKVSPHISVLNLFTSEDRIKPILEAFQKIRLLDYNKEIYDRLYKETINSFSKRFIGYTFPQEYLERIPKEILSSTASKLVLNKTNQSEVTSFIDILTFNAPIMTKLVLTELFVRPIFDEIVTDFKEVFPKVEDVGFELIKKRDVYELQIKERESDWISQHEISSGMFKTLLHIAAVKLMADGHVVMIDEFENGLGVNCIDTVASELSQPGRNLQYIITSHHPYIINNISMKHWKVVIRKGVKVSTKTAEQLKLGKSKHKAFQQLLNLDEFAEGIY
ncbi:MAG: ATP-binding protein [bacterium]|nr:ATP-binding protein [bacterium]